MLLGVDEPVADGLRRLLGAAATVGEERDDGQRAVVHERRAEQPELVGVALGQPRAGVEGRVGVGGGLQERDGGTTGGAGAAVRAGRARRPARRRQAAGGGARRARGDGGGRARQDEERPPAERRRAGAGDWSVDRGVGDRTGTLQGGRAGRGGATRDHGRDRSGATEDLDASDNRPSVPPARVTRVGGGLLSVTRVQGNRFRGRRPDQPRGRVGTPVGRRGSPP